jgi:hypothetical protein
MCFFYYLSVFMFIRGHPEEVTQRQKCSTGCGMLVAMHSKKLNANAFRCAKQPETKQP